MTPERAQAIKRQALNSVAARANNPKAPGVSMVAVTPHEALALVEAYEKSRNETDDQQAVP